MYTSFLPLNSADQQLRRGASYQYDFNPATIDAWRSILARQFIVLFSLPTVALVLMAFYTSFGNISLIGFPLEIVTIVAGLSNFLIFPFTLINFRCPSCSYFVGNKREPHEPRRLYHFLINPLVKRCHHCQAVLR